MMMNAMKPYFQQAMQTMMASVMKKPGQTNTPTFTPPPVQQREEEQSAWPVVDE